MRDLPDLSRTVNNSRDSSSRLKSMAGSAACVAAHGAAAISMRTMPHFRQPVPCSELNVIAVFRKQFRPRRQIDALGLGALHDHRPGANQRLLGYDNRVPQGGIDADEAIALHMHISRDDNVRRDETVIVDDGVMTDMIAAPQRDVVADRHERLHRIVLKNEAVL